MALFGKQRIGIDLGTANTLIYIENKGIALREPSIVARKKDTKEVVAFGREAEQLVGRTSENFEMIRPLRDGVIADFSLTKLMLANFIKQAIHRTVSKPDVVICVPSNISKVERRAVIDAVKDLGIRKAMIVDEPYAAAIGAGLNIYEPRGKMIVDIGSGTTDIAVISYGEIVKGKAIVYAGHKMNELIMDCVREDYQLAIGYQVADEIKMKIGNALYTTHDEQDKLLIKGRNIATGMPDEKVVRAHRVAQALDEVIQPIMTAIKQVFEETPPELAVDVLDFGIILTGGGSLLKRLAERMQKELNIPVHLVDKPLDSVVVGAGKLLKEMERQSQQVERQAR
ncbi:rod shape-determining protein [Tuanshanicoccus lijuaniae]|uniref:rod shape-determining protein MreB n=1 Tax=Aerococcaceae bacterium zg-1292 TaxID=2774330 RepID=UPI0019352D22|nr:rod shape-determining protein [Aerococcaceae bacterium zg-1292]MBF6625829.1 rod shape-determining protein [Aerococcaceae bacterium zg-BR9]MBF6978610.1 rod shape-determining protein [Aerococcaceae bacterium zg-BR22]MBS4455595.1 rod shape-determining protein [Aerococcaceae bacterium zg-A91]MBS4457214.1 rod shape-determining protein [Aerococcaceae bacterium zg-BR33]